MKKILITILYLIPLVSSFGQDYIYIGKNDNRDRPAYEGKSYVGIESVRLIPDQNGHGFTFKATPGNSFYVKIYSPVNNPANPEKNFVRTETLLTEVSDESSISALPPKSKATTYSYVDELGRSTQDVSVKASPSLKDQVAFRSYDAFGREKFTYLPYVSSSTNGGFRPNPAGENGEQDNFYTSPPIGVPQETDRAFSQNEFEESPLNRVKKTFGPGKEWYTAGKAIETKYLINDAAEVLQWVYNGANPVTLSSPNPPSLVGHYPANILNVFETKDEGGKVTRVYQNFLGQTVLQRVGTSGDWHDTYTIYDWEGNIFCVIPPEASIKAAFYNTAANAFNYPYRDDMNNTQRQTFLNDWVFQYDYDEFQRVVGKKIPGSAWMFTVYDQWDRPVLTQDGNLRTEGKWLFTKYDEFNRPIVKGFYNSSASPSAAKTAVKNHYASNSALKRFEIRLSSSSVGYTLDRSFPANPAESDLLVITYFDDHDFKTYSNWDAEGNNYGYQPENDIPALEGLPTTVKGHQTGSKVKILGGSTKWLNGITYYDKKYNVVQTIAENHLNGIDRGSFDVDFVGRIRKALYTHSTTIDGSPASFTLLEESTYDHGGRLIKTEHTLDGQKIILSAGNYNELGDAIEKNLHALPSAPSSFLQSIDTRHNIRGWITHINNSSLTQDGNNNDANDLFGMEMLYNQSIPPVNGTTPAALYDGNIAAIKWKSTNLIDPPKEKVFGFTYDTWSRLLDAKYATKNGGNFDGDPGLYDNSYSYDRNGNINSLVRYGNTASGRQKIDQLGYGYVSGNRLKYVNDAQAAYNTPGTKGYGFTEDAASGNEYIYDDGITNGDYNLPMGNGNMTGDMNKGLDITYNHLNLPVTIEFSTPSGAPIGQLNNTYDALGNRIKQQVTLGSTIIAERDYIGPVQYENKKLAFVSNAEGRAIKDGNKWFYEYQLRDLQNNTMVSFGALEESIVYKAGMETTPNATKAYEENTFKNILNRRENLFNHTPATADVPSPSYSEWTNGALAGKEIGPAIMIPVNNGDRLKAEIYAHYVKPGSNANADVIVGSLLDLTTSSLGISVGEAAYGGFQNYLMPQVNTVAANGSAPKMYLNYIIFNNGYNAIPQFGYKPVSLAAETGFEKLELEFEVPPGYSNGNGWAYIYVTNESNYYGYFDDVHIVHEKTNPVLQVTQQTDYYPFGLTFNTYEKKSVFEQKYKFQGQEHIDDLNLGWDSFKWRNHQPEIGRFFNVDPLSEKYSYNSPYAFSENRVVNGRELEGLEYMPSFDYTVRTYPPAGKQFSEEGIRQGRDIQFQVGTRLLPILIAPYLAPEVAIPFMVSDIFGVPALPAPQAFATTPFSVARMPPLASEAPIVAESAPIASELAPIAPKVAPVVAEEMIQVRHHTAPQVTKSIESDKFIKPTFLNTGKPSNPALAGVDVEYAPFSKPSQAAFGQSQKGAYVEFTVPKSSVEPIPGGYLNYMTGPGSPGFNAGRIMTGGKNLSLGGTNPKYVIWKSWWRFN